jgi:glutathione S-transferase
MNAEPAVILYHAPPSFYSQIARIVLVEKGVSWQPRLVAAGPPIFESYQPWYMKLNPGGTVPTLIHNGKPIPDSLLIAEYVDRAFDGPALVPDDVRERAEMERWIAALKAIPVRELSYGGGKIKKLGAKINAMRMRRLRALAEKHPGMAAIYRAKEQDIRGFADNAADPAHLAELRRELARVLDEMETVLAERLWLAGGRYSLADSVWTVGIARFQVMDLQPLDGRPALTRWFDTVKHRPSYAGADIWDRIKPGKILAMLASKLWPYLTAIAFATAALIAAIWWLW